MKTRQQGFNLISLLIGTTLSMIGILAMLSLYKNLIGNAAIATQDARQDGQVASSRLVIQRELQSAGYGLNAQINSDLVLLKSTTLASGTVTGTAVTLPSTEKGNALLWRYQSGNSQICMGILSSEGAVLMLKASSCSSSLVSLSWSSSPLIGAPAGSLNNLESFSSAADDSAFSLAYITCQPYQKDQDTPTSHLSVTVTTNLTASTAGSTTHADANNITVCLPNFPSI